jgi:hypothetical protein
VFHPTRLRIVLLKLSIGLLDEPAVSIKQNGPGAGRALIERENY